MTQAPLEPQRQLVLDRVKELGLTLNGVSREIGRNAAYLHQFIHSRTPRYLPRETREALAIILDIPEDMLRFPDEPPPPSVLANRGNPRSSRAIPAPRPLSSLMGRMVAAQEETRDVPLFRETDVLDPVTAKEKTWRPSSLTSSNGIIALWISKESGRLRPGDMAYVSLFQPPRVGDVVAIIDKETQRLRAIGDLVSLTNGEAEVRVDGQSIPVTANRDSVDMGKVICVVLA